MDDKVWQSLKPLFKFAYGLASVANIALFLLWVNMVRIDAQTPSDYSLNAISVQITILGTVMAAIGIGLALAGFWGYQNVKDEARKGAEAKASDVAREVAGEIAANRAEDMVQAHLNKLTTEDLVTQILASGEFDGLIKAHLDQKVGPDVKGEDVEVTASDTLEVKSVAAQAAEITGDDVTEEGDEL